eukprot:744706-Amorphochlora_amoeboformis.AAC.1
MRGKPGKDCMKFIKLHRHTNPRIRYPSDVSHGDCHPNAVKPENIRLDSSDIKYERRVGALPDCQSNCSNSHGPSWLAVQPANILNGG